MIGFIISCFLCSWLVAPMAVVVVGNCLMRKVVVDPTSHLVEVAFAAAVVDACRIRRALIELKKPYTVFRFSHIQI
jgi:TRAP-type mannitol/chloroaromatic compound transport system permease small subunit